MFSVCEPFQSDSMLEEFLSLQEANFQELELDFQILDMPKHELGAPAYRKYDIEAWFPGRQLFGEISSCSNCTDYQARRLRTKIESNGKPKYAHTVNGTACAIPRIVMALVETHQKAGNVLIPKVLQPFFGGNQLISEKWKQPAKKLKGKGR